RCSRNPLWWAKIHPGRRPGASDQPFVADKTDAKGRASAPTGRARTFRPYDPTQQFLLPPSIDNWLPKDHIQPASAGATWVHERTCSSRCWPAGPRSGW
ncbi:MAG: hypothetical protein ACYCV7_13660, partial [Acidimicrobiales bacterium]